MSKSIKFRDLKPRESMTSRCLGVPPDLIQMLEHMAALSIVKQNHLAQRSDVIFAHIHVSVQVTLDEIDHKLDYFGLGGDLEPEEPTKPAEGGEKP